MTDTAREALLRFAEELARLRGLAGSPSLNELVEISAGHPHRLARSTISDKLNAKSLPDWDFVLAFVAACTAYAARAGTRLPEELTDLSRWDSAHWHILSSLDAGRDRDRLAAAARVEIKNRRRRLDSAPKASRSPAERGTAEAAVPRQLPAAVAHFTGRRAQYATLTALARPAPDDPATVVMMVITGTAGVGKTALAVHWAHQQADEFADGQLYVNLRGFDPGPSAITAATAIRGFLDALGVGAQQIPTEVDAQAALFRSLLAGRRMLILLDNARDADHVRPLLPGTPGCLVLITSRHQMSSLVSVEGAHTVTLDVLTTNEAVDMFASRVGAQRTATEPIAVQQIVASCAHLPLALAIVAARAAMHPAFPLAKLADQLEHSHRRLDMLTGGDPSTDLPAVLSWSYHTLSVDAARLFRLLGLHRGPDISVRAAASLAALPTAQVRPLLAQLASVHLIIEHLPDRYTFHDLLREFASGQAREVDPEYLRRAAVRRIFDHYLHSAHTAAMLLDPHREPIALPHLEPGTGPERPADYQEALDWFITEHRVLLTLVHSATEVGLDTHTWQLAWTAVDFFDRCGHWDDHLATGHAAIAAAHRLGDRSALARAHRLLSRAFIILGRLGESRDHLHQALDIYALANEPLGLAHTYLNLAFVNERQGRHDEALSEAEHARTRYEATGHQPGLATALGVIGWCHAQLGNHHEALSHSRQALALQQQLGYLYGQATAWDNLGDIHHRMASYPEAVDAYHNALELVQRLHDRRSEANALTHIGDVQHAAGNIHAAYAAWKQALIILDELGHPQADQVRAKLASPEKEDR